MTNVTKRYMMDVMNGGEGMRALVDRFILLVLCLVSVIGKYNIGNILIMSLVGFCFAGISYYVENRYVKYVMMFAFVGITLWADAGITFFPLYIYEITDLIIKGFHKRLEYVCVAIIIISGLCNIYNCMVVEQYISIVSGLLAVWLCISTDKCVRFKRLLIETRDSDEQLRMELENRNRVLILNQDNEIYTTRLKERNRIAREIHDNVGHMLSRAILQMGAVKTVNKDEKIAPLLDGLHETLDTAMNNIRTSVHGLHDESLNLEMAVKDAIEPLQERNVSLTYDMTEDIDRNVKYCLVGVLKEAVTNIVKHSDATEITIMLREHPAFYQMVIADNGNKAKSGNAGIGLINMMERVKALNGTFNTNTEKGYKILVFIPKEKRI